MPGLTPSDLARIRAGYTVTRAIAVGSGAAILLAGATLAWGFVIHIVSNHCQ